MQQVSVIIAQHSPKQLNGANGPYTLHKFKAADGTWFQTTKTPIANEVYGLAFKDGAPTNAAVTLSYEPTPRGEYINNVIHGVVAGGEVAAGAPTGGAPTGQAAPAGNAAPTGESTGGRSRDDYQRSKEEMRRTAAFEIAAVLYASESRMGDVKLTYPDFLKIAARVEKDIANGTQAAASQPQAQTSSSSVGGEQAAAPVAAAEAPAAEPELAAAPSGPTDDIPF